MSVCSNKHAASTARSASRSWGGTREARPPLVGACPSSGRADAVGRPWFASRLSCHPSLLSPRRVRIRSSRHGSTSCASSSSRPSRTSAPAPLRGASAGEPRRLGRVAGRSPSRFVPSAGSRVESRGPPGACSVLPIALMRAATFVRALGRLGVFGANLWAFSFWTRAQSFASTRSFRVGQPLQEPSPRPQ